MTKTIDFDLLLHLFENNFTEWDSKLVSFLNQKQAYRKGINRAFSKMKVFGDYKKDLLLDYMAVPNERNVISDSDKEYTFIFTSVDGINKLVRMRSFSAHFSDTLNDIHRDHAFTLKQLGVIYKLTRVIRLDTLIRSMLVVNNQPPSLDLNLDCLDTIDEEFFTYFSNNRKQKKKTNSSLKKTNTKMSNQIEIKVK